MQERGRFWSDSRGRAGCPGKQASPAFQFFYLVKEYHLRYSHASFYTVPSTWKVPPLSPVIFQVALKLIHSLFHLRFTECYCVPGIMPNTGFRAENTADVIFVLMDLKI